MAPGLVEAGDFRPVFLGAGSDFSRYGDLRRRRSDRGVPRAEDGSPAEAADRLSRLEARSREAARRILELHANFVLAPFERGFPPEMEREELEAFEISARVFRDHGLTVLAGVTVGWCFPTGSFAGMDWYALCADGKRAPAPPRGSFMTCWSSAEWVENVRRAVREARARGADGVFFDGIVFGAAPFRCGDAWIGDAGCRCRRCRSGFLEYAETRGGRPGRIPRGMRPGEDAAQLYCSWRAGVVRKRLEEWCAAAREALPGGVVACMVPDAARLNMFVHCGVEIEALGAIFDAVVSESGFMGRLGRRGLVYDAPSLEILRERSPAKPTSNLLHLRGAESDPVYHPQHFQVGIAEAVSTGCVNVVKGGGFRETGARGFTELTGEGFAAQREAVGVYLDWIEKNAEIYEGAVPAGEVGLLFPSRGMRDEWGRLAPVYFKLAQTFTELHVMYRVLIDTDLDERAAGDVRVIVVPPVGEFPEAARRTLAGFPERGKVLFVGTPPAWMPASEGVASLPEEIFREPVSMAARFLPAAAVGIFRRALSSVSGYGVWRGAARFAAARMRVEGAFVNGALVYTVPRRWKEIHDTVRGLVEGHPEFVLVEGAPSLHVRKWRGGNRVYYHVVNHLPFLERMRGISLKFPRPVRARIISPDENRIRYLTESAIVLPVMVYTVIEVRDG
ncbi:MAG: hypothetical protein AB1742_00945 [bacterium]